MEKAFNISYELWVFQLRPITVILVQKHFNFACVKYVEESYKKGPANETKKKNICFSAFFSFLNSDIKWRPVLSRWRPKSEVRNGIL